MTRPRRMTARIRGVMEPDKKGQPRVVRLETLRSKYYRFETKSRHFVRGQDVEITYTKRRKCGTLEGVRLSRLLPWCSDPDVPLRDRRAQLSQRLRDFQEGLNGRRGALVVEGLKVEVEKGKGWFRVPVEGGVLRAATALDAAKMVLQSIGVEPRFILKRKGRKHLVEVTCEPW